MEFRVRAQIEEACGPLNRYYCSLSMGRPIADTETLLCYFIRSGGAADFAIRYRYAMSRENRWYCSEYFGYEVTDPATLWDYYTRISKDLLESARRPPRSNDFRSNA
jgi:hypothetical protein